MPVEVKFNPIKAATLQSGEDAQLVWVNQLLAGLLVPAEEGWFLQIGFGPWEGEGTVFPSLAAAEAWVRKYLPENWPPVLA
jgi:hypothetical protein